MCLYPVHTPSSSRLPLFTLVPCAQSPSFSRSPSASASPAPPDNTAVSPKPSSGGSGLSTGVLTAIIVSAVVVVIAVVAAIIVIRRTSESGSGSRRLAPGEFSGAAPSNRLLS